MTSGDVDVTAACDGEREPDPSDSLRTFGAVVQALREHAGLSRVDFGARVRFSKHTVESVELGRRMPDESFVERAEEALGNTGALRKAARHLTRGEPGLAAWFRRWARLEKVAVSLCTYECRLVPGLLQSEGYARAAFENSVPPLSDEQMEAQVAARMQRQELIRARPNTSFSFVMEEYIVRRRLGGTEVTRGQLDHILALAELRNVTVQIMPIDSECHAGLDGPLALLEAPDGRRLAYSEGQKNGRLIADVTEAAVLHQRYATLRSQALNPLDSVGLLKRIRGAL
ncbi:helix-turn-helix domain-containing protein [Streptomyces himalayensis]|uniref:Helix-turn-helix domain-containing protein n=1 Tax=Streptomyces himalayensis subsp. himalayensis TaxID=2756131 RepID=A0A7W0I8N5_9ACTN|nr:helix-turn-helix transcriptional regulator [Streptomyces himalayensis]MBA2946502.1 helix-turn-helix domain-containing protein [Streptomyces himalayensis subsp. himalayensis]